MESNQAAIQQCNAALDSELKAARKVIYSCEIAPHRIFSKVLYNKAKTKSHSPNPYARNSPLYVVNMVPAKKRRLRARKLEREVFLLVCLSSIILYSKSWASISDTGHLSASILHCIVCVLYHVWPSSILLVFSVAPSADFCHSCPT